MCHSGDAPTVAPWSRRYPASMPVEDATYSSAHLRERDKILQEKHKKEIAVIERKIERLKWSNNDTVKQLFEAQNRCQRLAHSLGFKDIYEAQVTIDTADYDTSFKDSLERIHTLEAELLAERNEGENLKEKLRLSEEEKRQMQLQLEKMIAEKLYVIISVFWNNVHCMW